MVLESLIFLGRVPLFRVSSLGGGAGRSWLLGWKNHPLLNESFGFLPFWMPTLHPQSSNWAKG